jgi:hypothetical protein
LVECEKYFVERTWRVPANQLFCEDCFLVNWMRYLRKQNNLTRETWKQEEKAIVYLMIRRFWEECGKVYQFL